MYYLLLLSTVCSLAGYAYAYLFWGGPWRTLFWNEALLGEWVTRTSGRSWTDFVTDPAVGAAIDAGEAGVGLLLGATALVVAAGRRWTGRLWSVALGLGFLLLLAHALLVAWDRFLRPVELFEYALRVAAPLLLYRAAVRGGCDSGLLRGIQLATALTFAAHGLYALGYYPVPGDFLGMTTGILGVGEGAARSLLRAAGVLDLLVAVLVFVPRAAGVALGYAAAWGLATALARLAYGWGAGPLGEHLGQQGWAVLVRLGHALIPLAGYLLWRELRKSRAKF